ncbi:MAG: TlpA disulfide reductase family protein [Kofleriaceae bacterium]
MMIQVSMFVVAAVMTVGCSKHESAVPSSGERQTGSSADSSVASSGVPAVRGKDGEIPLLSLDGKPTTLAAHGARVTVIAVWATYCKPCREELPRVEALYQKYKHDRDVSIIAVSIDDPDDAGALAKVGAMASDLKLTMPVLVARDDAFVRRFWGAGHGGSNASGSGTSGQNVVMPALLVIDEAFRVSLDLRYDPTTFDSQKSELIELAKSGKLSAGTLGGAPAEAREIRLPPMTPAKLKTAWPRLRAQLSAMGLTDQQLETAKDQLEAQARERKPLSVKLETLSPAN